MLFRFIASKVHAPSSLGSLLLKLMFQAFYDAPLSSLMDSTSSPKVKTTEGEGVRVRSLVHCISRVEGHARDARWGLGRLTSDSIPTRTCTNQTISWLLRGWSTLVHG
jgi:hypothetical protein